ncbi:hypothetical protein JW978_03000 [Candidatus Dojkabacteria bacterium]|nr:hypothetical protein [Candidatus Dojkabacteria bacterium]
MDETITTNGKTFVCLECKNEVEIDDSLALGDVIECSFCGIEYEYTEDSEEGKVLKVIEEEK